MIEIKHLTPRETVEELDRYIISQDKAKRAVAIALRNRWRRRNVPEELRDEIAPKNIIMIGPTGVGKTEIARRLAKLGQAPFLKVEASKFTEVGYVGRDVDSMIRDLTEIGINMVKSEALERGEAKAQKAAEERLLDLLMEKDQEPEEKKAQSYFAVSPDGETMKHDLALNRREELRRQLKAGLLNDRSVKIDQAVQQSAVPTLEVLAGPGMDDMLNQLKDTLGSIGLGGAQKKERQVKVPEALRLLTQEESEKQVDMEQVVSDALDRVQNEGILFLDEIDKIALTQGRGGGSGPDVSRGGVQRDLLPLVEGCSVTTKHGIVKTDHILFIAAGAFHESKVSDLIPELQGRFPIRVELETLTESDFLRILTEPKNSLTRQSIALLATENIDLSFTDEALAEIARVAYEANTRLENIGARRLHTVMEALLEEISFNAPDLKDRHVVIDGEEVRRRLGPVLADEDLGRYIL